MPSSTAVKSLFEVECTSVSRRSGQLTFKLHQDGFPVETAMLSADAPEKTIDELLRSWDRRFSVGSREVLWNLKQSIKHAQAGYKLPERQSA